MDKSERLLQKPVYPGGREAMSAFILEHMIYPQKAIDEGVQGTVAVVIDIDHAGYVIRSKVKKSLGAGLDEEALRLASLLRFKTGNRQKQKVVFHRTINIHFKLPKKATESKPLELKKAPVEKKQAPQQGFQITYSFVPSKKK